MKARLAHLVLIAVGLLILAYPLTIGATPSPTCRGTAMQPGAVCPKAGGAGVQTYEQRAQAERSARPVILVLGVLVAGFGTSLLVTDLRRGRPGPDRARS